MMSGVAARVREIEFQIPWEGSLVSIPSGAGRYGVVLGSLLPPGFDRYLRVFHPFVPWDAAFGRAAVTCTWRQLADDAGVAFGPTLTWRQLAPVLPLSADGASRPWAVSEGELEAATADALFEDLEREQSGPYLVGFELAAYGRPGRALLYRCEALDDRREAVAVARAIGVPSGSPEYVWPDDVRWIVRTDWDLTSTYVALSHDAAERILADSRVEAVEVNLDTRIDDAADERPG